MVNCETGQCFTLVSSSTAYVSSVSSNPVGFILCSTACCCPGPTGGGSGEFRHVCISALPLSLVIIGWSFLVANVYTCPVSLATSSMTWVPVRVDSSYAYNEIQNMYTCNIGLDKQNF